jgi:hypothetical protein
LTKVQPNVECLKRDRPDSDSARLLGRVEDLDHTEQVGRVGQAGAKLPLSNGLVADSFGGVGVAIYPGQSAEDVLKIADVIQRDLDKDAFGHRIDHYLARDIARNILLVLAQTIG